MLYLGYKKSPGCCVEFKKPPCCVIGFTHTLGAWYTVNFRQCKLQEEQRKTPPMLRKKLRQRRIQGGGGPVVQDPPPSHFWGTPNFKKSDKRVHECVRMHHFVVLNSYIDHAPSRNPVSAPVKYEVVREFS